MGAKRQKRSARDPVGVLVVFVFIVWVLSSPEGSRKPAESAYGNFLDARVGEVWMIEGDETVGLMDRPDWDPTEGGDEEATRFWFGKHLIITLGRGDRFLVCEQRKLGFLSTYFRVKFLRQSNNDSVLRPVLQGWIHWEWVEKGKRVGHRSDVD